MARRALVALILGGLLLLVAAPGARAHDHELPTAELHHRDLFAQQPSIETYCWVRLIPPWGTYCDWINFHYPPAFRLEEAEDTKVSIRLNKVNPPDKIFIRGWTYIDRYPQIDETYGRGKRFEVELRPTLGHNGPAWYADFVLPESRHWYLRAYVMWKNIDGRPGPGLYRARQYVYWQFHVFMPVRPPYYPPADPDRRRERQVR